jgi:hypothetical protein
VRPGSFMARGMTANAPAQAARGKRVQYVTQRESRACLRRPG